MPGRIAPCTMTLAGKGQQGSSLTSQTAPPKREPPGRQNPARPKVVPLTGSRDLRTPHGSKGKATTIRGQQRLCCPDRPLDKRVLLSTPIRAFPLLGANYLPLATSGYPTPWQVAWLMVHCRAAKYLGTGNSRVERSTRSTAKTGRRPRDSKTDHPPQSHRTNRASHN